MDAEEPSVDWVPEACTLPTADQPLRVVEFDELFASSLRSTSRPDPVRLRLVLDGQVESGVRDLAARETACCSFFGFEFHRAGDELVVDIVVPAERVDVLDALAARAEAVR